jgi:hypothetical protein
VDVHRHTDAVPVARGAGQELRRRATGTWPCTGRSACSAFAATWLILTGIGYTLLFWSLGDRPLRQALVLSGSSIYTLGFEVPPNMPTTLLAFSEAGVGLVLLAMLISYLPSMYKSFQRREAAEAGVPLKADLEQAWRDFAGWRVNYDRVLLALAALTMAPHAP